MIKQEKILEIHEHLIQNRMMEALDILQEMDDKSFQIEIINLKARVVQMNKNASLDILSLERLNLEQNNIRVDILKIVQHFDQMVVVEVDSHLAEIDFFQKLLRILNITKSIFLAQRKNRFKLVTSLKNRLGKLEYDHIPELLSDYYDQMTPKEIRLHKVIRGYTGTIIKPNNDEALNLLQANPAFISKLDRLEYLEKHLIIWQSKYKTLFELDESIALIYVGNDEDMRFPVGIEDEIQEHLENLQADNLKNE
ncbi:MAG: hypothetical protein AAF990_27855 [Bacteroidota bacterium]